MSYIVVNNIKQIYNFVENESMLFIDTETTGLKAYQGDLPFSLQIGKKNSKDILYIPLIHTKNQKDIWYLCDEPFFLEEIKNMLEQKSLVAHNAKFDLHMINAFFRKYLCIDFNPENVICTMHFTKILFLNLYKYSLDSLSYEFRLPLKADLGLSKKEKYDEVAFDKIVGYACRDIYVLQYLYDYLINTVKSIDLSIKKNFVEYLPYELHTTCELYYMEKNGVLIDTNKIENAKNIFNTIIKQEKEEYKSLCGIDFVSSPKSIQKAFDVFDIKLPLNEKNNPITDEEVLKQIEHPLAKKIIYIRGLVKNLSTYVNGFEEHKDENNLVHTNFNAIGAVTGRMSCSTPNLQNIPRKCKEFDLRSIIIAPENFDIISIDFAQQELRVIMDLANEKEVIKEILAGKDLHQANADLAGIERQDAKNMIFGILYGEGAKQLAINTNKSVEQAGKLIVKIKRGLPAVTNYMKLMTDFALQNGFIVTPFGVKIPVMTQLAYKSTNAIIQGTSASITKKWLVKCSQFFRKSEKYSSLVHPCLVIHDEICFYVHHDITKNASQMTQFVEIIKKFALESSWSTAKVPMDVDAKNVGSFWKKP